MAAMWQTWAVYLSLLLSVVSAQTIVHTNSTDEPNYGSGIVLRIARAASERPDASYPVRPLTQDAGSPNGLSGAIQLLNNSNSDTVTADHVALISCDPNGSLLTPTDVFRDAASRNARAIVFYATTATTCHAADLGSYRWVYTLTNQNDTNDLLQAIDAFATGSDTTPYARIGAQSDSDMSSSGNNDDDGHQTNALGPSPSTAVAMIILYSITGVITALFLIIIITGAVRAHRHPERYGPRNAIGRTRQTRARGIARAMLDSIPIVKFGDRENQETKPGDVEMEAGQHGRVEYVGEQDRSAQTTQGATDADGGTTRETAAQPGDGTNENGIAAAVVDERQASTQQESQGCSICTDDFEVGQDQRVLPCDHRFHPECIDPWLLNVSGTCPLCRIDLRPRTSASTGEVDTDEHGNPIRAEGDNLAPPLGEETRRSSVRRSIMLSLMGITRPERLTREERVRALREYRERVIAEGDQTADDPATASAPAPIEEESSRRRRLRNVLRIRTRRTGEEEVIREESHQEEHSSAAQSSSTIQQVPETQDVPATEGNVNTSEVHATGSTDEANSTANTSRN